MLLCGLYKAEAQLGERVFDEPLFLEGGVAAGFVLDHGQQVDGVARDAEVGLGLILFSGEQQTEMHLCLSPKRKHQKLERSGRKRIILIAHLDPILRCRGCSETSRAEISVRFWSGRRESNSQPTAWKITCSLKINNI